MKRKFCLFLACLLFAVLCAGPSRPESLAAARPAKGDTLGEYSVEALSAAGLKVIDDTDAAFTYSNVYTKNEVGEQYGGSGMMNQYNPASYASVVFEGSYIGLVMAPCYNGPNISVTIDGVSQGTVSLYAAQYTQQQIVFVADRLSAGRHILEIDYVDMGVSTEPYPYIEVDAAIVEIASDPFLAKPLSQLDQTGKKIIDDTSPSIVYQNMMLRDAAETTGSYQGTTHFNGNTMPCSIQYSFTGTYLGVVMSECYVSLQSHLRIAIDGVYYGTITLQRQGQYNPQTLVFAVDDLSDGSHTVVLSSVANALSDQTFVEFDAFVVEESSTEPLPPAPFPLSLLDLTGCKVIDDTDPAIRYSSEFTLRNASDTTGSYQQTTHFNNYVLPCSLSYSFSGEVIGIVLSLCYASPDTIRIVLDGVEQDPVGLYAEGVYQPQTVVFYRDDLTEGKHTITLECDGFPNPDRQFVEFDGFVVSENSVSHPDTGDSFGTLFAAVVLLICAGTVMRRKEWFFSQTRR